MKRETRSFYKRYFCLVLALGLIACWCPDLTPKAQASAIPMPTELPLILPDGSGLDISEGASDIVRQYKIMTVLNRAAGIQWYDKYSSAPMPVDHVGNALEVAKVLYSGLSEAEKALVWAQAQAIEAGAATVEFGKSLVDKVRSLFSTSYPAQSTETQDGVTIYTSNSINVYDMVNLYGENAGSNKALRVTSPLYFYDSAGNQYVETFEINWDTTGCELLYPAVFRGIQIYSLYFGWVYRIKSSGKITTAWSKTGIYDTSTVPKYKDIYFNPPKTTTNDYPEELPDTLVFTVPTTPDTVEGLKSVAQHVNTAAYSEILAPPDEPELPLTVPELISAIDISVGSLPVGADGVDDIRNRWETLKGKLAKGYVPSDIGEILKRILQLLNKGILTQSEANAIISELDIADSLFDDDPIIEPPDEPDPPIPPITEPEGINWQPLLDGWSGLPNLFPFSLPWDLANIFRSLQAPRQTPRIEIKLPDVMFNSDFVVDLSMWDETAALIRSLVLGLFTLCLIIASYKFVKL